MRAQDRIIVALDVSTLEEAQGIVAQLHSSISWFKVGLELLTKYGAERVMEALKRFDVKIMYDGKFHDIPNTVAAAVRNVVANGADMFTIHASTGTGSLKAAVEHSQHAEPIAVTVLTSLREQEVGEIYGRPTIESSVLHMAQQVYGAGITHLVCSAEELGVLGKRLPTSAMIKIVPGTRSAWAQISNDDQNLSRSMTPAEAIKFGANMLVIGRQVTRPPEYIGTPQDAMRRLCDEIDSVILPS